MLWTAFPSKAKPNYHLTGKYDANQKQKKADHFWKKRTILALTGK